MESSGNGAAVQNGKLSSPLVVQDGVLLSVAVAALVALLLFAAGRYNYLLFHTIAEVFTIAVAGCVFALAWNTRGFAQNHYILLVGIAHLFIGVLHTLHLLAYEGLAVFHGYGPNLATQLWVAARYLTALSYVAAPIFLTRPVRRRAAMPIYTAVTGYMVLTIFVWRTFPACFEEGVGLTRFKVVSEFIIAALFLGSVWPLWMQRALLDSRVLRLLTFSLVTNAAAEIAFTLYVDVYGMWNMLGHYLVILAFYLTYKAIVETGLRRPYEALFLDLKQSEAQFAAFMRHLPGFAYMRDAAGRTVYTNPAAAARGTDWAPGALQEDDVQVLSSRKPLETIEAAEYQGESRMFLTCRFPIAIGSKPALLGGISIDITERRRVEEELERLGRQNQLILDAAGEGIFGMDREGRTIFMNPTAARLVGYEPSEVIGQDNHALVHHSRLDGAPYPLEECPICAALEEGGVHHVSEDVFWHKDGTPFPVEYTSTPVLEKDERVGVVVTFRDITERKKAEEAIEFLARFVRENPNPVLRFSREGHVLYANRASGPLLKAWGCRLGGELPENRRALVADVLAEGQNRTVEEVCGKQVFSVVLTPCADFGYVNAYAADISERVNAEKALRRTTGKLVRSNQDLEQFAYVASHDLQEPLRMVTGYLQLLERRYAKQLDADALEFIAFAVDGARRMETMIRDLLAYSRVQTSQRPFLPTDCAEVVETALTNLRLAVEESGAAVRRGALPTVSGDRSQLVQLFQNLLANAVKFRSPSRPLEIDVGARQDGDGWLFWVRDNGIGIQPQQAERVFTMFHRLHGRTEYPGTGIGLAICKRIAERHGGRIWVESAFGEGSTFCFTIAGEMHAHD